MGRSVLAESARPHNAGCDDMHHWIRPTGTLSWPNRLAILLITVAVDLQAEMQNVWVDTDPACGIAGNRDIDDCLALTYLLLSDDVNIVAISLVFGNAELVDVESAMAKFRSTFRRSYPDKTFPPVYPGATQRKRRHGQFPDSSASRQLVTYFRAHPGVIVALGPVTNIATALWVNPGISANIKKLILVAGTTGDSRRFFPGDTRMVSFRDFNLAKDRYAFAKLFATPTAIWLAGYELAEDLAVTTSLISSWQIKDPLLGLLIESATPWQEYWRSKFGIDGFYPFDLMAAKVLHADSDQSRLFDQPDASIRCVPTTAVIRNVTTLGFSTVHSLKVGVGDRPVMFCRQRGDTGAPAVIH